MLTSVKSSARTNSLQIRGQPPEGDYRIQFRPLLTSCVSVLPFSPDGLGRTLGNDWRGQDRGDTTRLF
jgi:hypothetical protein